MAFKKHNPGCPCCYTSGLVCDCPNGGKSRKFFGTPTVLVTVTDLPSILSFETVYQTSLGANYWTTVTLTDLNNWNGTYALTLNKAENGCVLYDSSNETRSTTLTAQPVNLVRRTRDTFNTCVVTSTGTVNRTSPGSISVSRLISPYLGSFEITLQTAGRHEPTNPGGDLYEIIGRQRLICEHNFDPTLDERNSSMGAGIQVNEFYPKDQHIYLVYAADTAGWCGTAIPRTLQQIGKITAEFIDDMP